MRITVAIPTYNRADILRETLRAYVTQTGDHGIVEVLVVDDGSSDHTADVVGEFRAGGSVRYLRQSNRGQAAARNYAIREAKGELILFGDDDIVPSPSMTAEHLAWHNQHPQDNIGILGFVTWLPAIHPTPFMMWEGLYGPQFDYGRFKPGMEVDFRYAYSCNLSIKTRFLRENGVFRETFRTYGYEDVELSHRLAQKGYKLLYNPSAVGYHNKTDCLADALSRVDKLYRSWPEFAKTAAGEHFLELWRAQKAQPQRKLYRILKTALVPLKALAVPLLRPLVDSRLPLPYWVYERVFYHYTTSFTSIVNCTEQQLRADSSCRESLSTQGASHS